MCPVRVQDGNDFMEKGATPKDRNDYFASRHYESIPHDFAEFALDDGACLGDSHGILSPQDRHVGLQHVHLCRDDRW